MRFSVVFALALVSGCNLLGGGNGGGGGDGGTSTDPTAKDEAAYTAEQAKLDQNRSQFLDATAQELDGEGARIFWKTYPVYDPVLHSRAGTTGATIDYGFSIGTGDNDNYRSSASLLVVAIPDDDTVQYLAYDPTQTNTKLGELDLPAPGDGTQWYAYATSGNTLYVMMTGTAHTLLSWQPGQQTATTVTTLESAGATSIGEFDDFDVQGDTLVFIESGRLWTMSIAQNKATFLGNMTQIAGSVDFESDGVTFEDSDGLKFFEYASSSIRDLSMEIATNSYVLNATYDDVQDFYSASDSNNFSRWQNWVVYTSNGGIYAYDLVRKIVMPVLLSPITGDTEIDYRYPVTLDDGSCFIVGLTSTDGAVGADGPVYLVPLATVLN
jgi:hypothetical protein